FFRRGGFGVARIGQITATVGAGLQPIIDMSFEALVDEALGFRIVFSLLLPRLLLGKGYPTIVGAENRCAAHARYLKGFAAGRCHSQEPDGTGILRLGRS